MKNIFFLLTLSIGFLITSCSDPCKDITCSSVGTCDDGTCICDPGYTGANCETEIREKFLGNWKCLDWSCAGSEPSEFIIRIGKSNDVIEEVAILVVDNLESKIIGTVEGNSIIIDAYKLSEDFIISATISLVNEELTLNYDITEENDPITNCKGTATKI